MQLVQENVKVKGWGELQDTDSSRVGHSGTSCIYLAFLIRQLHVLGNACAAEDRYFGVGDQAASLVVWYGFCLNVCAVLSLTTQHGKFCFQAIFIAMFAPSCAEEAWKFSACLGKGMPEGEVQWEVYSSWPNSFTFNCWSAVKLCWHTGLVMLPQHGCMLPPASPAAGAAAPSREMKQAAASHNAVALQLLHHYSAATNTHLSESMVSFPW